MHSTLTLCDGETPAPRPASARGRKGPAGSELCLLLVTFTSTGLWPHWSESFNDHLIIAMPLAMQVCMLETMYEKKNLKKLAFYCLLGH